MKKRSQKKKEPRLFKKYAPLLNNFIGPLEQFSENLKVGQFRTEEAHLRSILEKQFETEPNGELLMRGFLESLKTIDINRFVKIWEKEVEVEINKYIQTDERFQDLHHLLKEAEAKCFNISFVILFEKNLFELIAKSFEPLDLMEQFENQSGEIAARTAVRIYREVAELLYSDYLNVLNSYVQVIENKKTIHLSGRFGTLAAQLPKKLEKLGFNNLVDADAGWLRNATCHGHWIYKPETGKIALWDLKKPERMFTPFELVEKAMEMYMMVTSNYFSLVPLFSKSLFYHNDWLKVFRYLQLNIALLLNGHEKTNNTIDRMISELFSDLAELEFKA